MSVVHVKVKTIEDKICSYVENNSEKIYIDYRDELSSEQVNEILEGKADQVRCDIEEYAMCNSGYDGEFDYYWEKCRDETGATQEDIDGWLAEDGFYPSYYLDDHGWNQLISNTTVNISGVMWNADWNFYDWAYSGPVNYSDVRESLKVLGINPKDFLDKLRGGSRTSGPGVLKGWFPDMPAREAKVSVDELYDNMCSLYNGVLHFCFGDLADIIDVVSSDSKNLVIKKGTNLVMYDRSNGAGITEAQLTGDVTIKRKDIEFLNDNERSSGYGVQACYGFVQSYWNEGSVHNGK